MEMNNDIIVGRGLVSPDLVIMGSINTRYMAEENQTCAGNSQHTLACDECY